MTSMAIALQNTVILTGTHAYAVGGQTDENVYTSIIDQNAPTTRTSGRCEWILSRKIGGSEHITQESPAQDPPWNALSQPDDLQPSTAPSESTYHFPIGLW